MMKIKTIALKKVIPVGAYRTISLELGAELDESNETLSMAMNQLNESINMQLEHIMNSDVNTGFTPKVGEKK